MTPLEPESSAAQENVSVVPAPTGEEVNDDDHDQVSTELRRFTRTRSAPEWYDNPVLEIMLLDNGNLRTMKKRWRAKIPTNCLKPCNPRQDPCMKTDADGNVTIYKSRLVTKCYQQVQGVDYDETFSPVAKLKSV